MSSRIAALVNGLSNDVVVVGPYSLYIYLRAAPRRYVNHQEKKVARNRSLASAGISQPFRENSSDEPASFSEG